MKNTTLLTLLFCLYSHTASATMQTLSLSTYPAADCKDYTGTWQGTLTDVSGLFGDGGPWPVTVSLYQHNGYLWGRTTDIKGAGKQAALAAHEIWARCQDGILHDIFWGKQNQCGALSQQGALLTKNLLVMKANWENAMTNASFLLLLQRKNNKPPYYEPEHVASYRPADIKSCH